MALVSVSSTDESEEEKGNINFTPSEKEMEIYKSEDVEFKHSGANGASDKKCRHIMAHVSHTNDDNNTCNGSTTCDGNDSKNVTTEENVTEVMETREDNEISVDENEAPDGGWGWCIVIGALCLRTVLGGMGRSHGLFYLKFKERFQGTATATALVTSLTGFVRMSGGPIVSILSGRFRCRLLTSIGTIALSLGLILTAYSPNLPFLFFSYGAVVGIGRAFALTPVPILLGYYFNKRRSLAFGLASAGFSIGGLVITPIIELLFQNYGYWGTFLILSGFALNILVASALFRPIELHRKFMSLDRRKNKPNKAEEENRLILKGVKKIETGTVLGSSTASLNQSHIKTLGDSKPNTPCQQKLDLKLKENAITRKQEHTLCCGKPKDINRSNTNLHDVAKSFNSTRALTNDDNKCSENNAKENESNKQTDNLLQEHDSMQCPPTTEAKKSRMSIKCCCLRHKSMTKSQEGGNAENQKKTSKYISWSVLKDTRFLCLCFAMFCFSLPTSSLFLPALAKSRGISELQAATLLSVTAGGDTVFRIISGVVLDLKIFRTVRPQIYNIVTFLQGIVTALFPSMTTYSEFMILCVIQGAIQGTKMAQGTVIMLDMLGVDKLASSLAVTMTVQCVSIFIGPTVSGQLIDRYNSYDGAYYFGAGAIILGGLVMAGGNIAKHCSDRKNSKLSTDCKNR